MRNKKFDTVSHMPKNAQATPFKFPLTTVNPALQNVVLELQGVLALLALDFGLF